MIRMFKQLFFPARFFVIGAACVVIFAFSFALHWLFPIGLWILAILFVFTLADLILLFASKNILTAERQVPHAMSLGDENKIVLKLINLTGLKLRILIYDEMPYQFQKRNFYIEAFLGSREDKIFEYEVTPTTRGKYTFGNCNLIISSPLGLVQKKLVSCKSIEVPVYPSIIQMKKYELKSQSFHSVSEGIKRYRRVGHSYEFDQVKEYVIGDDSRSINWKASGRKGALMVNLYEDERSQQVYTIIDKSRAMRMPFNNLTLLDHAINSALVISNVVLQKYDKAGLITFSDKIGTVLPAEKNSLQLKKILEALYNEQEHFLEAEYELLYHLVRNVIKNRGLIFLYTNFESYQSFERVLPILRQINKLHLLVVVFFDNEEVISLSKQPANRLQDIYLQILSRKYLFDKGQIVTDLNNHGIHAIKSLPSELSINTINKYLELKSRRMI